MFKVLVFLAVSSPAVAFAGPYGTVTVRLAIAPLIIAALISAAAAAAGGIAGAAGTSAAADAQAKDATKQRALQEKIARMQLAEQQRQSRQSQLAATQQLVGSAYQDAAQTGLNRAAERQASRQGIMSSLARTFLGE